MCVCVCVCVCLCERVLIAYWLGQVFNRGLCCAPSLWWGMNSTLRELVPPALEAGLATDVDTKLWLDTGSGEHQQGVCVCVSVSVCPTFRHTKVRRPCGKQG